MLRPIHGYISVKSTKPMCWAGIDRLALEQNSYQADGGRVKARQHQDGGR